jgi:pyrroline-5-carboxylate reductase
MDFLHLAEDYATRGGLNEQVLLSLTAHGVFAAVTESLDAIHARVTGSAAAASDSP